MRLCPLLLLFSALLPGCTKEKAPLLLDFVGASRYTSGDRTVAAGDTLTSRIYAESRDDQAALRRLRITATYTPTRQPVVYPAVLSTFDPAKLPTQELVYLDSVLAPGNEFVFQTTFAARTTSGTERWAYTVTDADQRTATRAYRLTVRKADSLAAVHQYPLIASLEARPGQPARTWLEAGTGLLLPGFSVRDQPANQVLIDLVFTPSADGRGVALQSPTTAAAAAGWPAANRRATQLRRARITAEEFDKATTTQALQEAFTSGQTLPNNQLVGLLAVDDLIAFQTTSLKYGLMQINSITLVPTPTVRCTVRVAK